MNPPMKSNDCFGDDWIKLLGVVSDSFYPFSMIQIIQQQVKTILKRIDTMFSNQNWNVKLAYALKNLSCIIGLVSVCILTVTICGCDPDIDDSPEDGPLITRVDPEKNKETVVSFVSSNPISGGTIRVNSEIKVSFNGTPKNISVNIFNRLKGKVERTSDKSITIKGPFNPGSLVLEVKWEGGSKTLKYDVKGAVYNRAEPSSGSNINPFTEITVSFTGEPEQVKVNHGIVTVTGNTIKVKDFRDLGDMSLRIQWRDGDVVLKYNVSSDPVAKIHEVWVDYDVFEGGRKGMRIHVKFSALHMQFDDGSINAYFYFKDGAALKDFNGQFSTVGGKVVVSRDFQTTPLSFNFQ